MPLSLYLLVHWLIGWSGSNAFVLMWFWPSLRSPKSNWGSFKSFLESLLLISWSLPQQNEKMSNRSVIWGSSLLFILYSYRFKNIPNAYLHSISKKVWCFLKFIKIWDKNYFCLRFPQKCFNIACFCMPVETVELHKSCWQKGPFIILLNFHKETSCISVWKLPSLMKVCRQNFFSLFKSLGKILHCLPTIKSSVNVQVHLYCFLRPWVPFCTLILMGMIFGDPLADGTCQVQMNWWMCWWRFQMSPFFVYLL